MHLDQAFPLPLPDSGEVDGGLRGDFLGDRYRLGRFGVAIVLQDELGDLMVIGAHDPVLRNPRVLVEPALGLEIVARIGRGENLHHQIRNALDLDRGHDVFSRPGHDHEIWLHDVVIGELEIDGGVDHFALLRELNLCGELKLDVP